MSQLNEKILDYITERIGSVMMQLSDKESYDEKSNEAWNALSYIEGLLDLREREHDCDKNVESDDDHHNRIIDEAISALNKIKREYPNTQIALDVPDEEIWCYLGRANIYVGSENEIIIDAE